MYVTLTYGEFMQFSLRSLRIWLLKWTKYLSVSNIIHTLGNGLYPFGATRRFPTYINICGFVMLIFNIIFQNDEEEENGFWLLIELNVFSKLRKNNCNSHFSSLNSVVDLEEYCWRTLSCLNAKIKPGASNLNNGNPTD